MPALARLQTVWRRQPARVVTTILYAALVLVFLNALRPYYHRNTGFTELIDFGDQFYHRTIPAAREAPHVARADSWGYDGQFYAQLALEPLLRDRALDQALDYPPYRARRILFSWTAFVIGLGRPAWILKVFAVQNIVAWLALAGLLTIWIPPVRLRNVVPWTGCLFGAGMMFSVRLALLEGPGLLVVTLAILAHERSRHWLATVLMGLSGLGRETNMIGSGLLVERMPRSRKAWLDVAAKAAVVVLPFMLWALYVHSVYPELPYSKQANFSLPLAGYLQKWSATVGEISRLGWTKTGARFECLMLIGLTTQAIFLAIRRDWTSAWWRMAVPYCVLFLVTSYIVWEGEPSAAPRVLLPMSFAFNILIARLPGRWFWPLAVLGNLSVLSGIDQIKLPGISNLI